MSTRCQVKVVQKEIDWTEEITLYHHYDGYPSNILPLFKKAKELIGDSYEAGRAGKVASYLCAVDPGQFEPESGHELHSDIEYYYVLYCVNTAGGSMAEKPVWEVEIYEPKDGFWDNSDMKHLKITTPRTKLNDIVRPD